jgi:hypothetical protein
MRLVAEPIHTNGHPPLRHPRVCLSRWKEEDRVTHVVAHVADDAGAS